MLLKLLLYLFADPFGLGDFQLHAHNMTEAPFLPFTLTAFQCVLDFGLQRIRDGRPLSKPVMAVTQYLPFVLQQFLRHAGLHRNIHTLVVLELVVQVIQNQRKQFIGILPPVSPQLG